MEEDSILENMKKTAFHEAGHVFLHELCEIPYKSVQIFSEQEGRVFGNEEPPIDPLIYACICFSGAVAQDKYADPSCSPKYYGISLQEGVGVNGSDFDQYKKLKLPENHFLPLLDTTRKAVIDIDHWELISKIANAPMEKKKLQSEEVKQILEGSNLNRDIVEWVLAR